MDAADVIVVGLGGAGMTAAITAHDAGAEVLVLEKMPQGREGGNTRVSGQVWFSPKDAKLAETYFRELAGEFDADDALAAVWAQETSQNTDWVRARATEVLGEVQRDPDDVYGQGADITTITHGDEMAKFGWPDAPEYELFELDGNECGVEFNYIGPSEGHSRLWFTLKQCVEKRQIPIRYGTRAVSLVQNDAGEVIGVNVETDDGETSTIHARRGVIVASGGFAANPDMVRNYLRLPIGTTWGSPGNTGDGIRMAQAIGADLAHPYNYMAMPGIQAPPYVSGDFAEPAGKRYIYVGADGRRFMDETITTRHGKIRTRGMFDFFPGVPMWTIFDEDTRLAGPLVSPRSAYAAGWLKQVEGYEWSADNSAEIERGWIVRADTIRELGEALGIDADGLEDEVARYNADCAQGQDTSQGRPAASLAPVARPPFYGYRWAGLLITTLGGIRKDERARALDPDGNPIPRLYCAGDVASSYSWALSGGNAIADAMAFGRVAAREAAGMSPIHESERQLERTS